MPSRARDPASVCPEPRSTAVGQQPAVVDRVVCVGADTPLSVHRSTACTERTAGGSTASKPVGVAALSDNKAVRGAGVGRLAAEGLLFIDG